MSSEMGTWTETMLGNLGDISGGGTPSTQVASYWGGDIPWLVPNEVTKNRGLFITRTERTITAAGLAGSATKLLPVGTVFMTSRATIGLVTINTVPMATNQGFINVVCNPRIIANEFFAFWIQQNRSIFEDRANGVTFKEITKSNFRSIPILLPSLAEQQAIAHALHTVQAAGEARRREIALERERKAALMHHLFTHGTHNELTRETEIGPLPASWSIGRLGDFITLQRGFDITSGLRRQGIVPVISSSGITGTHDEARVEGPGVVIGRKGTIGTSFFVEEDFWPHDTTLWVKDFHGNDPKFVFYFFESLDVKHLDVGAANPTLNRNHVHILPITLPLIQEQHEIADVLSACDATIAALEREAALHGELFRAMLEALMSGRLSALPLVENPLTASVAST